MAGLHALRRRPSVVLAAIAALAVAGALTVAGRFEYLCEATVRVTGPVAPERLSAHRRAMLDYAWSRDALRPHSGRLPMPWFVDTPDSSLLRFGVTAGDRAYGVELARSLAEGFCAKMAEEARAVRTTPTPVEDLLAQTAARLQTRLNEAQAQVDAAVETLPDTDPSAHRTALLTRWRALRSDFDAARRQLAEATVHAEQLHAEPPPEHGLVTAGRRQAALEADAALQQDLKELAVNLTELKAHLLDVWQQAAGPLEQLALALDELSSVAAVSRPPSNPRGDNGAAQPRITVAPYAELVARFAESWNRDFVGLRGLEVSAYTGEVLDVYHRVRRSLNDFLFSAAKLLASMRASVRALVEDPSDSARHHVLRSNLVRAFERMQAAHHRFEFKAGALETPDNVRLDAALRSARGLRRRTQDRIAQVEQALQAEATRRARQRRIDEITQAEVLVEQVRTATDETVDALLALQDELHLSAETSEAFLRAVLKAEIASARLKLTQDDLNATKQRLHELETERTTAAPGAPVEFVSAGVVGRPINLSERLRAGAIGGGLTFLLVLLAQWWITRRHE
jgi:hypothetical protein